jgi:tRNA A-37 threonylcarbamoyl transferase component Bud32
VVGRTVGNYRVVSRLGEGGMGVVYLAEHPRLGRRVAVKFLRPELARGKRILKRFFNEARAATAIRHPGIVDVYDFGTLADGSSYITMEFLEGESLAARLKRTPRQTVVAGLDIALQVAGALGASHSKKIIHRDLKPDNLFLVADPHTPGLERVKVLDFGIAKLGLDGGDASVRTRTGSVLGTPLYMSPEQCRGSPAVDHRTDIYSLGVVLYEMLCGRPPFVGRAYGELAFLHIGTPAPSPRTHNPNLSPALEDLLLRTLAKEPEQRFDSMAHLEAALRAVPVSATDAIIDPPAAGWPGTERILPAQTTLSSTAGHLVGARVRGRRGRVVLWATAGMALTVLIGAPFLYRRWAASPAAPDRVPPGAAAPAAPAKVKAVGERSPPTPSSIQVQGDTTARPASPATATDRPAPATRAKSVSRRPGRDQARPRARIKREPVEL